jgi:hypothetical protein
MGRIYAVCFENVAVTAAQDFFEVSPADDKPVAIHACYLSQSTELGDAAEEQLRVEIVRGHATTGSGGSAPTPTPLCPTDTAAAFGAEANNTTIASAGTGVIVHAETFNVRSGWVYLPTPECRPICTQASGVLLVVRLMGAPADSVTMSGTLLVEELS